jgi:hypothetical protein
MSGILFCFVHFGISMAVSGLFISGHIACFRRAFSGAIAVEFALAAGPLLAVLLFIADMAANHMTFRQIDATGQALAGKIRAGAIDPHIYSAETFRTELVCPALPALDCGRMIVNLGTPAAGMMISSASVTQARWCPGGPRDGLILQLAYPVPFLSRIWAGNFAASTLYYVVSLALRNAPEAVTGSC